MNKRGDASNLRRAPSQGRSQKMVTRILDAARQLLSESDESAAPLKISTNHIAKKAGVSVGSLYQYFPNTEAVVAEVFDQTLKPIQQILREFDSSRYLSLPRNEFFRNLITTVTQGESDNEVLFAIHGAMKIYPVLSDMDRQHAEFIATHIARFLKYYGSTWDEEKLYRTGLYAYYMDAGIWRYRKHVRPEPEEARAWEVNLMMSIFQQCFE